MRYPLCGCALMLVAACAGGVYGNDEVDADHDSYGAAQDCNDADPNVFPGAPEVCEDGVDNDCSEGDAVCSLCAHGAVQGRCRCGGALITEGFCCDGNPQDEVCPDVDPCAGVTCSYRGKCLANTVPVTCDCDDGYHAVAMECVANLPSGCAPKDMAYSNASLTRRHNYAFPFKNGQPPSTAVESDCIEVNGLSAPIEISARKGELSVNNGSWLAEDVRVEIQNGDTLRRRLTTPAQTDAENRWAYVIFHEASEDLFTGEFAVRTRNNDRAPQTFAVGPGQPYRELSEVTTELRAGDTVEVYGDATYAPVEFNRAGLPDAPITVQGIPVNGNRPVIAGGDYTVDLDGAHHYRLEGLIITGGTQICLRHAANDVLLRDCYIHHCERHGILGMDLNSGTLILDRVEVSHAGGEFSGENLKHTVYVATDRDRYPGSKLKVIFSYIHDHGGNGIKSRAQRNEIYYNWLEAPDQTDSYYTIELDGFEEYEPSPGIDSDVVGNVLVHHGDSGIRVGGDGTGSLRGRVRLANNTFIVGEPFDEYTPVIRLFGALDAVYLVNNAFFKIGSNPLFRLWRNDIATENWVTGAVKFVGHNNWVPQGCDFADESRWPPGMSDTFLGVGNPGFVDVSSFANLNLAVAAGSQLAGTGRSETGGPSGYEISEPLIQLDHVAPTQRPAAGELLTPRDRPVPSVWNIGAL